MRSDKQKTALEKKAVFACSRGVFGFYTMVVSCNEDVVISFKLVKQFSIIQ